MVTVKSFAELAKVMGKKVKVKPEPIKINTFLHVQTKCGEHAAQIWAWMNEQEACKRYGVNGQIIHSPEDIAKILNLEKSTVVSSLITLMRNGFAKPTKDGRKVRAA